jgi:hypothetical protein
MRHFHAKSAPSSRHVAKLARGVFRDSANTPLGVGVWRGIYAAPALASTYSLSYPTAGRGAAAEEIP